MHRFYMHHSFTKFHRNVSILFHTHGLDLKHMYHNFGILTLKWHCWYVFKCLDTFAQIISPTTLFLAAKVEEQPRKLEHVIKVAHACLNPQEPPLDTKSNVSSRSFAYYVVDFTPPVCIWLSSFSVVMVSLCLPGCAKFPCPLQRALF